MTNPNPKTKVALCVLDGWGMSDEREHNAIAEANPEFFNFLLQNFPNTRLSASGEDVGLPAGQMGNSEVGHMSMGAGRAIWQDLCRIDKHLEEQLSGDECVARVVQQMKQTGKSLHIIGLASDGGVHSHLNHLLATTEYFLQRGVRVKLHLITDGRDTLPRSASKFLEPVEALLKAYPAQLSLATISGRYYAMDRDKRLERTQRALDEIVFGRMKTFGKMPMPERNPVWGDVVVDAYASEISDEFIEPQSSLDYNGMRPGDAVFFINFRADRMRQLLAAIDKTFGDKLSNIITMTSYGIETASPVHILFNQAHITNTLSDVLKQHGRSQLRIAETEKYAHVTFFFDAARENPAPNEQRIFVKSPAVTTYDLAPEMSAAQITDELLAAAEPSCALRASGGRQDQPDFILVNYANADMVGHTGNYEATVKAIKAVDACLKRLYATLVVKLNYTLVLVGDHGNAECMVDSQADSVHTAHTLNLVPFIVVQPGTSLSDVNKTRLLNGGSLCDVAPTVLALMNLPQPPEMTGTNLLANQSAEIKSEHKI